ncbi:MAG: DegV family protein [Oscillospiraceae bacterium]|jgi:DegV family protein with EDD domain
MKWNIIADSSCDLKNITRICDNIRFSTVPFIINIGADSYVDDETLDTNIMIIATENCTHASQTACPSPYSWYEQFEKAEQCIAITISSQLSGSYNSANVAKKMMLEKEPSKKIAILDSYSAGPALVLVVERLYELIEKQLCFEEVVSQIQGFIATQRSVFALSSFNNLIKNGRMSKLAGILAGKLSIWGVGIASDEGKIQIKTKVRGSSRVLSALIDDMVERGFMGGAMAISHCYNACLAEKLREKVKKLWQTAEIKILPTRGLCSYYAERGGLIVAF